MGYSIENIQQIRNDQTGECLEIGPDRDGLGKNMDGEELSEIRRFRTGVVGDGILLNHEQLYSLMNNLALFRDDQNQNGTFLISEEKSGARLELGPVSYAPHCLEIAYLDNMDKKITRVLVKREEVPFLISCLSTRIRMTERLEPSEADPLFR